MLSGPKPSILLQICRIVPFTEMPKPNLTFLLIQFSQVDALSAQLVGLQAEVGIGGDPVSVNLPALLEKLKQPLHPDDQPKAPVSLINSPGSTGLTENELPTHKLRPDAASWNDYKQYVLDQQKNLGNDNIPHKLKRSNSQLDQMSSEDIKTLLDWIHEENKKDLLE